ncbi:PXMP2/4 family protein 4-like [Stigmatopora nigra]
MKLLSLLSLLSVVTAFGVKPHPRRPLTQQAPESAFEKKSTAASSPLFRDPTLVRGGAVPGWAAYNSALDKNPLTAKACTSLVGWALGDFLAQVFITKEPTFDMARFVTLSLFGFLYHGPSGHYFYNWLDSKIPGNDLSSVVKKVAFDQVIWCPIFMTVFFTYLGLVKGDSFSVIGEKIKNDLLTACKGSWQIWPAVHLINFKFISTKHRLVFINGVQIAFNMFLSLIGSKK